MCIEQVVAPSPIEVTFECVTLMNIVTFMHIVTLASAQFKEIYCDVEQLVAHWSDGLQKGMAYVM